MNSKRTRRAFVVFFFSGVGIVSLLAWIKRAKTLFGIPETLRQSLEWNGKITKFLLPADSVPAVRIQDEIANQQARVNGLIGIDTNMEDDEVSEIHIEVISGQQTSIVDANVWRKLPRARETALFCCVEGWSQSLSYEGVRFSDLMQKLDLGKKADGNHYAYAAISTADGAYYVGLDIESLRHPQSLLTDKMNGQTIGIENGAPVRLIIPIKYGIKNIKNIARIEFTDLRPRDYWHERGYDWYADL